MSNLGMYQVMTKVAKKVGGPINLIVLTMGVGGVIYKSGEVAFKKMYKKIKKQNGKLEMLEVYTVTSYGTSGKDLILNLGDKYRILESDGESVLIEKIGDTNNPYFVSADFLRSISDFCE